MVSPTFALHSPSSSPGPAPLAWKEFRRRGGLNALPKVYVYDASPQIVPASPTTTPLTLSPLLGSIAPLGQDSPRRDHSGYLVSHVTQALQSLGASTGGNIAEFIANNFSTEQGIPYERGRKLHYMVNAILSSPKYKCIFLKDQVLKDEKRSLWRLKQPGDTEEDPNNPSSSSSLNNSLSNSLNLSLASLIPTSASLSSLIPASPALSLDNSTTEPPVTPLAPTLREERECGGGSDESRDDRKATLPRTTEHPPTSSPPFPQDECPSSSPSSPSSSPSSPSTSPTCPSPTSPLNSDLPMSLSSRRKKRKGSGLDLASSSSSVELMSVKLEDMQADDKRRRTESAA